MNIKIYINTFVLCIFTLVLSECSTSSILTTETYTQKDHDQSFFQYIEEFIGSLFYQKEKANIAKKINLAKEKQYIKNINNIKEEINDQNSEIIQEQTKILFPLPRNEALEIIRSITTKVFDLDDPYHISIHLEDLQKLTENLDPIIDKKTITAIHFLAENQHRTSYLDTIFWIKNIKEKELDSSIPLTEQVFKMSKTDKLKILQTKLARKKPELEILEV